LCCDGLQRQTDPLVPYSTSPPTHTHTPDPNNVTPSNRRFQDQLSARQISTGLRAMVTLQPPQHPELTEQFATLLLFDDAKRLQEVRRGQGHAYEW